MGESYVNSELGYCKLSAVSINQSSYQKKKKKFTICCVAGLFVLSPYLLCIYCTALKKGHQIII